MERLAARLLIALAAALPLSAQMVPCAFHWDTGDDGADVSKHPADSHEECCRACAAEAKCAVAVYRNGNCRLKSSSQPVPGQHGSIACALGEDASPLGGGTKASDRSSKFDCAAGITNWQEDWTPEKRKWCCSHDKARCPHDCDPAAADREAWSADKKEWCCLHRGVACPKNVAAGEGKEAAASTTKAPTTTEAPTTTKATTTEKPTTKAATTTSTTEPATTTSSAPKATTAAATAGAGSNAATEAKADKANAASGKGAGTATGPKRSPQQCWCMQNTDYQGGDIASLDVFSQEECCDACANDPRCVVTVFLGTKCWLKNSTKPVLNMPSRVACIPGTGLKPYQRSAKDKGSLPQLKRVTGFSCATTGCAEYNKSAPCQCNARCAAYSNCCYDQEDTCPQPARVLNKGALRLPDTCADYGCVGYEPSHSCQCNDLCSRFGNCCSDYEAKCKVNASTSSGAATSPSRTSAGDNSTATHSAAAKRNSTSPRHKAAEADGTSPRPAPAKGNSTPHHHAAAQRNSSSMHRGAAGRGNASHGHAAAKRNSSSNSSSGGSARSSGSNSSSSGSHSAGNGSRANTSRSGSASSTAAAGAKASGKERPGRNASGAGSGGARPSAGGGNASSDRGLVVLKYQQVPGHFLGGMLQPLPALGCGLLLAFALSACAAGLAFRRAGRSARPRTTWCSTQPLDEEAASAAAGGDDQRQLLLSETSH